MRNEEDLVKRDLQEQGKGIRVRALSTLQDSSSIAQTSGMKNVEKEEDVIVLSSDSEPPPEGVPPSVRRRRRKRNLIVKNEVEESLTQTRRKSVKQQKMDAIALKNYRIQDYFNTVTKDEYNENFLKNIKHMKIPPSSNEEGKELREGKQVKKKEINIPLRQYSSTRARNPVTNIFIKRGLGKSTNLKMFGKKHLSDQQKKIYNYFTLHRGSTFRSYYDTFKESIFPVMISGDIDIDNFLSSLLQATESTHDLFDYKIQRDHLLLSPRMGCSIDDEVHLIDLLDNTIKKEEVDVEVNPECRKDSVSSCDSAIKLTEPEKYDKFSLSRVPKSEETNLKFPKGRKVVCPPFKIIKGTTFAVDAFRYGIIEKITQYFLTHFHADHYVGLKKSFNQPIHLTAITANFVKSFLKVQEKYLNILEYDVPKIIDGVEVTAIDANHCPGAAMFLFKLPSGECILHTGDFRASFLMEMNPIFWNNNIDTIYLDTTYLESQIHLPSQDESIQTAVMETQKFLEKNIGQKCLVIVGTYVIGKEKVWLTLAKKFNFRVWLESQRRRAVECMENSQLLAVLCDDPREAQLHVLPLGQLNYEYVVKYMSQYEREFTHVLALRPSGWEVNSKPRHQGNVSIVGVTYSEHSSYTELRRFVRFLKPLHVINTVNAERMKENAKVPDKWLSKKIEPWRESQESTITLYFPLKTKHRVREEIEDGAENLTQLSLIAQCDSVDVASSSAITDWTF
ncbi:DNA cross-link repair 1A protein-like [Phlebotomus papatasi]|uniref:DNA repair metallo-beta-lactamase domain-containing protein n=1 Tax=Phlebotomus papatasi TaxID=29031 RepID=A0A1B0F097_PHLPP|nr:DNA cross-link repair 1A protein-like [Phlebotomus papatasi]